MRTLKVNGWTEVADRKFDAVKKIAWGGIIAGVVTLSFRQTEVKSGDKQLAVTLQSYHAELT